MNTQTVTTNLSSSNIGSRARRCLHPQMDEASIIDSVHQLISKQFTYKTHLQSVYSHCKRNLLGSSNSNLTHVLIDQLLNYSTADYNQSFRSLRKAGIENLVGMIVEQVSLNYTFGIGNSTTETWLKILRLLKKHNINSNFVYNKACDGINFILQEHPQLIKNFLTRKNNNPRQYEHWSFLMMIINHFEPLKPIEVALTQMSNKNHYINALAALNKIPKGALTDDKEIQEVLLIAHIFLHEVQSKKSDFIALKLISKINHLSLKKPKINHFIKEYFRKIYPNVIDLIQHESALELKKYEEIIKLPISSVTDSKKIIQLLNHASKLSKRQPGPIARNKALNIISRIDFEILKQEKLSNFIQKHFQHVNIDVHLMILKFNSSQFLAIDEPISSSNPVEKEINITQRSVTIKPKVIRSESIPTAVQHSKSDVKMPFTKSTNFEITGSSEQNQPSSQNLRLFTAKRSREENNTGQESCIKVTKIRKMN